MTSSGLLFWLIIIWLVVMVGMVLWVSMGGLG